MKDRDSVLGLSSGRRQDLQTLKNDQGFLSGAVVKNPPAGASLAAQWLRICLPMQGTWVRALVWEDPTCRGATGPVSHSY